MVGPHLLATVLQHIISFLPDEQSTGNKMPSKQPITLLQSHTPFSTLAI